MSDQLGPQHDVRSLPYRVAVLCYLYDRQGRLLMLHRRKPPNSGRYSPVGGKVEVAEGESPHACAAREVREEARIEAAPEEMRLCGIISEHAYEGQTHWLIFCFELTRAVAEGEIPSMELDEGRLEWVPQEQVERMPIPQVDREILWPLIRRHRGGLFFVDIDCACDPIRWVLRESVPGPVR